VRRGTPECVEEKPGTSIAVIVEQCREIIGQSAPDLVDDYAAGIGLTPSPQFQADVRQAILSSIVVHLDKLHLERRSDIRKAMVRVDKEAAAAEKCLRRLQAALDSLPPFHRDAVFKMQDAPFAIALRLNGLSNSAHSYAHALKLMNRGGAPTMLGFGILVRSLARAFEGATGGPAKVTWSEHRETYEGRFVKLVETMLPLALRCAVKFGRPMPCPDSPRARGKYIYEATRAGRHK
jgi:hypothetical protein